MHYMQITIAAALLAVSGPGIAGNDILTVGWDDACDVDARDPIDPIEVALLTDAAEVRVTIQDALTLKTLIERSIRLIGGYADCAAAAAGEPPVGRTHIDATTIGPTPLTIASDGTAVDVLFANFLISGSRNPVNGSADFAGGISIFETAGTIRLENLEVTDNEHDVLAGGIAIRNDFEGNPATLAVDLHDVLVVGNRSGGAGGGMACQDDRAATTVRVTGASGFSFNQAENTGGGLLINGCEVHLASGTATPGEDDPRGIHGNRAAASGGGVAVITEGALHLLGSDQAPVNVTGNMSDTDDDGRGNGGGIYLSGEDTVITADRVLLADNVSVSDDGGAVATRFGRFTLSTESRGCSWSPSCNLIRGNRGDNGGAIYAEDSSTVTLTSFEATGNRARRDSAFLHLRDGMVSVSITGALIHGNGGPSDGEFRDNYLIRTSFGEHELRIHHSTIADNTVQFASIVGYSGDDDRFELLASIVDDPGVQAVSFVPDGRDGLVECVLLGDGFGTEGIAGDNIVVGNPVFADRTNGDYRLAAASTAAIDQCARDLTPILVADADGDPRGIDVVTIDDIQGPVDMGYDEWVDVVDLIFQGDFED